MYNFALGKSYALLADAARETDNPNHRALIVRRSLDELRELIDKSQELYKNINKNNRWNITDKTWVFTSGAKIWMSYLEHDNDVHRYQGQAFNYIAFDELTQWPSPYAWDYMRSRLRSHDKTLKLKQRATSNPGGIGHNWVKKAFIDPSPYGKAFYARDLDTGETLRYPMYYSNPDLRGKPLFRRRFIPSRLSDNPYLFEDGAYEKNLLSLPEVERKRLLEGDWDVFGGAAFPEWNRSIHVIEPFDIPRGWRKFRACDYGYGSFSAVVWFAVTPMDQLIVYRELYVTKVLAVDLADMILSLEADDGPIHYGVLDSSVWRKTGDPGPSLAEQMIARGCYWRPSDRSKGSRVAGKNEVHRRLQVDEWTGEPRILFFNNCTNLIAQLPVLPIDKDNPEDVDTDAEDHIYDALRYGCMSRPTNSNFDEFRTIPTFRPVDPVFGW